MRGLALPLFPAIPRTLLRCSPKTEAGLRHSVRRDMLNNRVLQMDWRHTTEMLGLIRAHFAPGEIAALGQSSSRENVGET